MSNKIIATELAGLEQFAGVAFSGTQGSFTLDEYVYFDDTSLFSTASFSMSSGAITAGTTLPLFQTPVGAAGQGFGSTNLTLSDTNLERGWTGGRAPANTTYAAIAGGFDVYLVTSAGLVIPMESDTDLFQVISVVNWKWNVGGSASPTLQYDPIKGWPLGAGVYGNGVTASGVGGSTTVYGAPSNGGPVSTLRKFAFPLFFPPESAVECSVRFAQAIALTGTNAIAADTTLRIAFHLRGYKLSRIVG